MRGKAYSIFVLSVLSLAAKEQHIQYKTETETYDAVFDDQRISTSDMQRFVWFSPNLPPDLPAPFLMISSYQQDKRFIVPALEDCSHIAKEHCGDQPISDDAFLANAASNLERGRVQIEELRKESIPSVLEPIKSYLLEGMEFYWGLGKARYAYIKTGGVEQLRKTLCEQCPCDKTSEGLLSKLKVSSPEPMRVRLRLTNDWYNRTHRCHDQKIKYPMSAWDSFKREFGIKEDLRHTSPE